MSSTHALVMANALIQSLEQKLKEKDQEIARWKQHHQAEVARGRLLKQRLDMPVERIKAYDLIGELQERLRKYE